MEGLAVFGEDDFEVVFGGGHGCGAGEEFAGAVGVVVRCSGRRCWGGCSGWVTVSRVRQARCRVVTAMVRGGWVMPEPPGWRWMAGWSARVRARVMVVAMSGRGMPPSGWWGARVFHWSSPSLVMVMVPRQGWRGLATMRMGPVLSPAATMVAVSP